MDASHLMRRQKSSLPLPFSIIATDIGAEHTQRLRKRMKRLVLRSFSLGPGRRATPFASEMQTMHDADDDDGHVMLVKCINKSVTV